MPPIANLAPSLVPFAVIFNFKSLTAKGAKSNAKDAKKNIKEEDELDLF